MRSPSSSSHSAPPLSSTVAALLKKTKHYDKDERYMATSDLCELLKRHAAAGDSNNSNANHSLDNTNGSNYNNNNNSNYSNNNNTSNNSSNWLDATTERDICRTVLELLHDKSHDVQAVAVKTLGVLLTTVQAEQVLEIAVSLTDQVLDANKSELRDVYAMGLRTLVQTCPTATGHKVAHLLTARLVEGIRTASSVSLEQQSFSHENTDNNNNNNNNNNAALVSLQNNRQEIVLACLDSLTDLLNRFGATAVAVTRHHEAILQLCLEQLAIVVVSSSAAGYATGQSASPVVRKRAGHTLACLSTVLSDALLSRLVQALLWAMEPPPPDNASRSAVVDTRSVVRTLCAVAAAVGHRLGAGQIDRILPLLLRFTRPADALTGDDDDDDENNDRHKDSTAEPDGIGEDTVTTAYSTSSANSSSQTNSMVLNELRESCLIGLESFVVRCPNEIEPHLESIVTAALAFMSYDPNYSYGEDPTNNDDDMGQDNNATEENEDAIEEDEEEDNYEDEDEDIEEDDDDDDESWKVRRSAIRVLMAVVESKRHNPAALWTNPYTLRRGPAAPIAMALVQRFKEREENCRVGVIDCFARLLVVSIEAATATLSSPADRGGLQFATDSDVAMMMMDADSPDNTENNGEIVHLQRDYAPALVKSCQTILAVKKGNDRSKSSTLALLGILCQAPGGVGGQAEITSVLSHAKLFLMVDENASMHREGTSKALRLDALSLVHSMLASHDTHNPSHLRNSLSKTLLPELCQAVNEQWYKVIAEALRALSEVPRIFVLGYDPAKDDVAAMEAERTKVAKMLYTAIEPLVAAHDVDQEIKECALKACAALLSSLHAYLASDQVGRLLALLLDRLNNETTRMAAIKTLSSMAAVESGCDLQPILAQSITAISSFLCLQSRSLNQCSMEALDVLVSNHGAVQDLSNGELYSSVLRELALHVTDRDLHLSHLSLYVYNAVAFDTID